MLFASTVEADTPVDRAGAGGGELATMMIVLDPVCAPLSVATAEARVAGRRVGQMNE
jgi:hypothetical protein